MRPEFVSCPIASMDAYENICPGRSNFQNSLIGWRNQWAQNMPINSYIPIYEKANKNQIINNQSFVVLLAFVSHFWLSRSAV